MEQDISGFYYILGTSREQVTQTVYDLRKKLANGNHSLSIIGVDGDFDAAALIFANDIVTVSRKYDALPQAKSDIMASRPPEVSLNEALQWTLGTSLRQAIIKLHL